MPKGKHIPQALKDEILEKVNSGDDSIIIRKDRLYLLEKIRKL